MSPSLQMLNHDGQVKHTPEVNPAVSQARGIHFKRRRTCIKSPNLQKAANTDECKHSNSLNNRPMCIKVVIIPEIILETEVFIYTTEARNYSLQL